MVRWYRSWTWLWCFGCLGWFLYHFHLVYCQVGLGLSNKPFESLWNILGRWRHPEMQADSNWATSCDFGHFENSLWPIIWRVPRSIIDNSLYLPIYVMPHGVCRLAGRGLWLVLELGSRGRELSERTSEELTVGSGSFWSSEAGEASAPHKSRKKLYIMTKKQTEFLLALDGLQVKMSTSAISNGMVVLTFFIIS